jgi:hypothetical protein
MPYQYRDTCFETLQEAAQSYCATAPFQVGTSVMACQEITIGGSLAYLFARDILTLDEHELVVSFPTCTQVTGPDIWNLSAEDGFILAAAVIGVWASAVAIRALIRALNVADTPASSE